MPVITPPPPGDSGPRVINIVPPQVPRAVLLIGLLLALVVLGVFYWWFIQRVEVPANHVLVLTHRVGRTLPDKLPNGDPLPPEFEGQVLLYPELLEALGEKPGSTRYKGIMFEVLGEGRYFYDPFLWKREIRPVEFIAQEETGVLIRKYGKPLAAGKVVATEPSERGPLAEKLAPDRYQINPYAYDIYRVPRVDIPAGHVGIQTLRHGTPPADANVWVVQSGERGVQPDVLSPGREYNNPYVRRIDIIDVRSHTLDLRGEGAIRFPSKDSFEIRLEATVEYAISQDKAPYVMVAIGNHSDIEEKLILPYARSLARIEGSKLIAREFISGASRESFQESVFDGLRTLCGEQGIEIRSTLIRRIEPPAEIANPISERQVAAQQVTQFRSEMDLAEARARLVEQEELQKQN
ncbi:MAG: hypothetical protein JXO22_15165, partial [Phycisphaerae bacterium]|nr:hypothetical protein [Phycisphaerae bacterium]